MLFLTGCDGQLFVFAKSITEILAASSLPALNLATFLASILIGSFVLELRAIRAARLRTEKVPKPTSVTFSPVLNVSVTALIKASNTRLTYD
jgi:hypothetical protein